MSQWGEPATFKDERAEIRVLPDVDTGKYPFTPISRSSIIAGLYLVAIARGAPADARRLFDRIAALHYGQPYADWPR